MKVNYLIVLLAITLFPSSPVRGEQPTNNEPTFIRSVNLVDVMGGRVMPEMDVLVADGRIQQIGHNLPRPKGARVVDGTKRFLVPGLWDMHVHTAGLSANPEWSRDTLLPLLVANGVTGIRDMGGSLAALQTWKRQISQGELVGPQIVRAGPMLDGDSDDPSVIAVKTPDQARHTVDQLAAQHVDFIKVLSGLDRDSYFAAVAESSLDIRRFRPNVLLRLLRSGPFQEDEWLGGALSFGEGSDAPAVAVTMRDERCGMVNLDPDSARAAPEVMKAVVRANENKAGIYGAVTRVGRLAVGQTVFFWGGTEQRARA